MTIEKLQKNFRAVLALHYDVHEIDSLCSLVIQETLGYSKIEQHMNRNKMIDDAKIERITKILTRLGKEEPLQYILGKTEFYGLPFYVDSNVLIPRQETEILVDEIIKAHPDTSKAIIDLGCGSGCIPISLKYHLPKADVSAIDISEKALRIAKKNADLNNTNISFDLADMLSCELPGTEYDIIISNPPYIKEAEKVVMKKNVLNFEPHLALFVPDRDALLFYRAIAKIASKYLSPDGEVWVEINEALGAETSNEFAKVGFKNINIIKDLNQKNRFIKAKRI